jgi:hypothetical protein
MGEQTMSDIKNLCSDIEDRLESFECCNDLTIDDIHIERNAAGEIKSVRIIATGEYRNPNHE